MAVILQTPVYVPKSRASTIKGKNKKINMEAPETLPNGYLPNNEART